MAVQLIGAPKEEKAPEIIEAKIAFIIYTLVDGSVGISTNLDLPVVAEELPSQQDIWSTVATVKRNIEATEMAVQAAQITLSNLPASLMQFQKQLMEEQQNQALVGQLGSIR